MKHYAYCSKIVIKKEGKAGLSTGKLLFNGGVVQAWSYEHSYRIGPITDAIVRLLFNGRVVRVWPYEHRCRIGPMTAATGRPLFID